MTRPTSIGISAAAMGAMRAHAEEGYPDESWGILFESPDGEIARRMTNVQNALHAEDPERHPRDARTAYAPDPQELMEANRDGDRPGWRIAVFYHSHPEHDAYFSDTDKTRALWGGDVAMGPAYPGACYVVLSVRARATCDVKAFAWDEAAADFREIGLEVRG
jgi:proteasome lid subunit RPN8/RPN11